jgi:hypothetical protein
MVGEQRPLTKQVMEWRTSAEGGKKQSRASAFFHTPKQKTYTAKGGITDIQSY